MPRRPDRKRSTGRRDAPPQRVPRLGAHWRADGAPKTSYLSRGDAQAAADERRQESGTELNVYQCDHCHAWHMGKSSGRED